MTLTDIFYKKIERKRIMKRRIFKILDIGCEISVVETTRKEVLSLMDNLIENIAENLDVSDEKVSILYKDGSYDYIDESHDGHKIRRQNIRSIIYEDSGESFIYGPYAINEYGVVTVSDRMNIDNKNIKEQEIKREGRETEKNDK